MIFELVFLKGAGYLVDLPALFKKDHGRRAHDLKPCRRPRIAVYVQLCDLESPHVLLGQLLEDRGQQVAVATSVGIELREHRPGEGHDFRFECPVCCFDHVIIKGDRLEGRVALAAFALVPDQGLEDTILGPAFRTLDDNGLRMQGRSAFTAQGFIFELFLGHPIVGSTLGTPDNGLCLIHFPSRNESILMITFV